MNQHAEKFTWRMRISSKLHMLATRIHDDLHTWELTTPTGETIRFSCYWQHTASWLEPVTYRCSCDTEELH